MDMREAYKGEVPVSNYRKEVKMLVEPYFKNFITELKLRGFSDRTIKLYLYFNRKFMDFCRKEPKRVTKDDIKAYMNKLLLDGLKERSRNSCYNALKAYYDSYLNKRLFNNIKRAKIPNDMPNVLSQEEIKIMIENTNNLKHRLLIELLYSSGMRISECLKVKIDDIDIERRIIFVKNGKGKKDRFVITSKKFIEDFKYHTSKRKRRSEYVFENQDGHMSVRTAQQILKQAAFRAGIQKRVYPHLMRASFATHLFERGVHETHIKKLLGHSKDTDTKVYLRARTDNIRKIKSPLDAL